MQDERIAILLLVRYQLNLICKPAPPWSAVCGPAPQNPLCALSYLWMLILFVEHNMLLSVVQGNSRFEGSSMTKLSFADAPGSFVFKIENVPCSTGTTLCSI